MSPEVTDDFWPARVPALKVEDCASAEILEFESLRARQSCVIAMTFGKSPLAPPAFEANLVCQKPSIVLTSSGDQ
jgi:hypothetical protein